jgi:hypothetical protein
VKKSLLENSVLQCIVGAGGIFPTLVPPDEIHLRPFHPSVILHEVFVKIG